MPRPCKLEAWSPESQETLNNLRKECLKRNKESTYDDSNQKTSYHVVKGVDAYNNPRFYIVARKYSKKVKTTVQCCPLLKQRIIELKKEGKSINQISKIVNLSCYQVNKIITSI